MAKKKMTSSETETDIVEAAEAVETTVDEIDAASEKVAADVEDVAETAPEVEESPLAVDTPDPTPPPQEVRSGPGFVPLLIGGIIAGGVGFGAGYYLDWMGNQANSDVTGSLETQSSEIASLREQTSALEAQIAGLAPPEVDLSGIETQLADLSTQIDASAETMSALDDRIAAVEARPIFTGDAAADEAALMAAIDQLRAELATQQEDNAVLAEDIGAMADAAQARIAEAEERAAEAATTASARASLSELRIAIASGTPFADPLAEVADVYGLEVPAEVQSVSETGVPTLAEIETAFPAAARAALPLALQANAGETAGDRLGAFFRSQVGGRSIEPREGDDPDAVLSRAGAAVATGDLTAALAELDALPEGAQAALSDWRNLANERLSALEALDGLSATLGQ